MTFFVGLLIGLVGGSVFTALFLRQNKAVAAQINTAANATNKVVGNVISDVKTITK